MLNSLANKKTTRNTKNSTIENTKQLSIAHQLAHSIRNEDSDHFFSIYDTIPLDWEESTVSHLNPFYINFFFTLSHFTLF
jgi:hypothetical protein